MRKLIVGLLVAVLALLGSRTVAHQSHHTASRVVRADMYSPQDMYSAQGRYSPQDMYSAQDMYSPQGRYAPQDMY